MVECVDLISCLRRGTDRPLTNASKLGQDGQIKQRNKQKNYHYWKRYWFTHSTNICLVHLGIHSLGIWDIDWISPCSQLGIFMWQLIITKIFFICILECKAAQQNLNKDLKILETLTRLIFLTVQSRVNLPKTVRKSLLHVVSWGPIFFYFALPGEFWFHHQGETGWPVAILHYMRKYKTNKLRNILWNNSLVLFRISRLRKLRNIKIKGDYRV